jgi:hypothetical protein
MPARTFSARRHAYLSLLLVLPMAALGFTAAPAGAATSSLCYLWPTTIVGPGHSASLTAQIMTGSHVAEPGVTAVLENWWTGAWHPLTSRTTDGAGKAAFTVTPTITNGVRLRFAGTPDHAACVTPMRMVWLSTDARVMAEAARHNGQPYQPGAAGPSAFDCSGYTQYVISRFGRVLPRTTQLQYNALSHIAKTSAAPGDLIFFGSTTTSIYHVGMYAGAGQIWHAPDVGQTVRKQGIWTSAYYVARL